MPIYEFECLDCQTTTEILMGANETHLVVCSHCGGRNLKKVLSAHTVVGSAGAFPDSAGARCCGSAGPSSACAGPGSCCGKTS